MKNLYIKQKVFSVKDRFTVMDEAQRNLYEVTGSFFKIPKEFQIVNQEKVVVAVIKKKILAFLPAFIVEIAGQETIEIKKKLTFMRDRYTISLDGLEVKGNWWDMDFEVYHSHHLVATIHKKWLSWGDTYEIQLQDETKESVVVALVIAIDCVKAEQRRRSTSTSS